jgi:integrase/recombinase XerD
MTTTAVPQNRTSVAPLDGPTNDVVLGSLKTADDVAHAWLLGYGGSTRATYADVLQAWGRWLREVGVDDPLTAHRSHVDLWVRWMGESAGLAPATIVKRLAALSGYYRYALDEELIDRSPLTNVRRPRFNSPQKLGLSIDEWQAIRAAALETVAQAEVRLAEKSSGQNRQRRDAAVRDHALLCLLFATGLRISEPLGADVADLSGELGMRTLRVTVKGGDELRVMVNRPASDALDSMLSGRDAGPLFLTSTGGRMDRFAAVKMIRRLAKAGGIDRPIGPHTFRHTFGRRARERGCDLRYVQAAMGHKDPATTARYDQGADDLRQHPGHALAADMT